MLQSKCLCQVRFMRKGPRRCTNRIGLFAAFISTCVHRTSRVVGIIEQHCVIAVIIVSVSGMLQRLPWRHQRDQRDITTPEHRHRSSPMEDENKFIFCSGALKNKERLQTSSTTSVAPCANAQAQQGPCLARQPVSHRTASGQRSCMYLGMIQVLSRSLYSETA